MRFITLFFLFFLTLYASSEQYQQGKALYFEKGCNGCHGIKAEGMTTYPALANRAKGFLIYKLKRFRDHISDNQQQEMMIPFALGLSDKEIDVLTTFLNEHIDTQEEHYDSSFEVWGDGGS
ncbi:MAG: cytochrome c [Campylobacterota bacterium]|nr:cytochrome c [Campylobacterota bacterium]